MLQTAKPLRYCQTYLDKYKKQFATICIIQIYRCRLTISFPEAVIPAEKLKLMLQKCRPLNQAGNINTLACFVRIGRVSTTTSVVCKESFQPQFNGVTFAMKILCPSLTSSIDH